MCREVDYLEDDRDRKEELLERNKVGTLTASTSDLEFPDSTLDHSNDNLESFQVMEDVVSSRCHTINNQRLFTSARLCRHELALM